MKYFVLFLFLSLAIITGCSDDATTNNNNNTTTTDSTYFPLKIGNWWQYKTEDSTATRTVIGTTAFNGKSYYMIYDASNGDSLRFRQSGTSYYTLTPDDLEILHEVKVLDETLNTTWKDSSTFFSIKVVSVFKTVEVGLTRSVNGKSYTNVIHVHADATTAIGTSQADIYFAKGIGQIEEVLNGTSDESLLTYHKM